MNKVLTVKQVNKYISGVFEDELILHDIIVSGEIFEFKSAPSGTFVVLKEEDNILECYRFGKTEQFEKGAKVTLRGRVRFYQKSGRISLVFSEIKYSGEGLLHADFLKLKERLLKEGIFDNKNTLPIFIKRVALITSVSGAVIHDIGSVIFKNHSYIELETVDVSVQGANAITDIVLAINEVNKEGRAEVIVIARGGGSYQDLQPFNSEEIARAVFSSKIPIISAVGHETDYTLCDFSSVLRAPTPSLAAEAIVKINEQFIVRMQDQLLKLYSIVARRLSQKTAHLSSLTRRIAEKNELSLKRQEGKLAAKLRQVSDKLDRKYQLYHQGTIQHLKTLSQVADRKLEEKAASYRTLNTKLDALSPLKLLSGGYARVTEGGVTIKSIGQIKPDQVLKIVLCDGSFRAKTIKEEEN